MSHKSIIFTASIGLYPPRSGFESEKYSFVLEAIAGDLVHVTLQWFATKCERADQKHTHTPEIFGCGRWKTTIPSFRRFMEIDENLFITSEKKRTEKRLAAWFVCSSHSQRANNTSWAWLDGIVVGNRRVHEACECECVTSVCPLNRSLGHETDNREMFPGFP